MRIRTNRPPLRTDTFRRDSSPRPSENCSPVPGFPFGIATLPRANGAHLISKRSWRAPRSPVTLRGIEKTIHDDTFGEEHTPASRERAHPHSGRRHGNHGAA